MEKIEFLNKVKNGNLIIGNDQLTSCTFLREQFNRIKLEDFNLNRVNYNNSFIGGSTYERCVIRSVYFHQSDFDNVFFKACNFINCTFEDCNMKELVIDSCSFINSRMKYCFLESSIFKKSDLRDFSLLSQNWEGLKEVECTF